MMTWVSERSGMASRAIEDQAQGPEEDDEFVPEREVDDVLKHVVVGF
jgi:hypothetical protein